MQITATECQKHGGHCFSSQEEAYHYRDKSTTIHRSSRSFGAACIQMGTTGSFRQLRRNVRQTVVTATVTATMLTETALPPGPCFSFLVHRMLTAVSAINSHRLLDTDATPRRQKCLSYKIPNQQRGRRKVNELPHTAATTCSRRVGRRFLLRVVTRNKAGIGASGGPDYNLSSKANKMAANAPVKVRVEQSQVRLVRNGKTIAICRTQLPEIENWKLINGNRQIVGEIPWASRSRGGRIIQRCGWFASRQDHGVRHQRWQTGMGTWVRRMNLSYTDFRPMKMGGCAPLTAAITLVMATMADASQVEFPHPGSPLRRAILDGLGGGTGRPMQELSQTWHTKVVFTDVHIRRSGDWAWLAASPMSEKDSRTTSRVTSAVMHNSREDGRLWNSYLIRFHQPMIQQRNFRSWLSSIHEEISAMSSCHFPAGLLKVRIQRLTE